MDGPGGHSPADPGQPIVLYDEPTATRRARRWAAQRLLAAGLDDLRGDVELVVAELVSNALLHAGPPAELLLHVVGPRVRVEVRDPSPAAPVRMRHGADAMTGRGLRLVAGVACSWGIDRRGQGKSIWVELDAQAPAPDVPAQDIDALLETWTVADDGLEVSGGGERRFTVRLGAVPTDLLLAAKAHVDDLVREFTLAAVGARTGATTEVPGHLADLLEAVIDRFADARRMIKQQALAAAARGEQHVTLELSLPPSAAAAGEEYLRALDEADAYCRAARLLTLETPPRHRVFRRWYVQELTSQLRQAARGGPQAPAQTFEQRLLAEIDAVADSERRAERSARLNGLAAALAAAVTPEDVADRAVREGVTAMGASGGMLVVTDGSRLVVPGTVGYDQHVVARLREVAPDADLPGAHAARTGQAVWVESRRDRDARFPELAGLEPRTVALCAVPLVVGERCLGALRFSFSRARLFDDDEREFASNMAAQTAQALDRAQLYDSQAETARRLQRNLLPPDLPEVPGVDVASRYDPAEGGEIGGDFYDLVGGGLEWTVVVGDVRGKGVDAAEMTAMARHTVRSGALRGLQPAEILALLNDAFLADRSPESFCTAVCGHLALRDGHADLTLACGGHPQPLLVGRDGTVESVGSPGTLVGAFPDATFGTGRVVLYPGDLVFFHTDGVTEARRDGAFFGRERLLHQLSASVGASAGDVLARVHDAVESFQTSQRDDLAMLALRLRPGNASS